MVWIIPLFCAFLSPEASCASGGNFLYRIDVKAGPDKTRITFNLQDDSDYTLSVLSGNRLRISFPRTYPFRSNKLTTYSDPRINRISLSECGGRCLVTVALRDVMSGYRLIAPVRKNLVSLDIGPGMKDSDREPPWPGREKIWNGTERLIREFEPSLRSDLPFIPTEKKQLENLMNKDDAKLFAVGEAALYDEKPAEAEETFRNFSARDIPARGMAECRLGEALYSLQKYSEALAAFREAEKSDPEYLFGNPTGVFDYADCLARGGDFEAGRIMLSRLIYGLAGTGNGTSLLVRLADMCKRAGHDMEALAIYRNVIANFPGTVAFYAASMRLDDMKYFSVNSATYRNLLENYRNIYTNVSSASMREESMFKAALLQSLYGPAVEAAAAVDSYEKKFPYGIFTNIAKAIHEHLLLVLYRKYEKEGDCSGLLALTSSDRDYLSECISEKGFARQISKCFLASGMKREEMAFFIKIADSEWAVDSAPFMYNRILEDAFELNQLPTAESVGRAFLERFPKSELSWDVIGRLGEIYFREGNMTEVISLLSPVEKKGGCAVYPESFYFLGKARQRLNGPAAAERDMILFTGELAKKALDSPFAADAFMVLADARISHGDDKGAMKMYRSAYEVAGDDFRDACLYKMGELSSRIGDIDSAGKFWQLLVKDGKDPIWIKMASDQLAELDWNAKLKTGGR